ncbi:hypothetical protein L6452_15946 [Arctium lappa]|uniref:Uncharacterized protein n=1 Tax=Arctium lappa TaxID=4217 RepID=A0ACB9CQR2_ARCLA|nr:hypothetical protein L6452_15946 [Arctium lappa]
MLIDNQRPEHRICRWWLEDAKQIPMFSRRRSTNSCRHSSISSRRRGSIVTLLRYLEDALRQAQKQYASTIA